MFCGVFLEMNRCIPYRYKNNGTQDKELEVLVISAQKGHGMQFPKVLFAPPHLVLFWNPIFVYFQPLLVLLLTCMCCLASGWLGNWWIHGTSCFKGDHRRSWSCWQCWSKCVQTLLLVFFFAPHQIIVPLILTLCVVVFVFLQGKLGKWYYKSKRQPIMHEGYMFPLLVKKELDNWPEMNTRKRRWVSV